jgi:hypothetical protein
MTVGTCSRLVLTSRCHSNGVADRVRAEMYYNIGLADPLAPTVSAV